MFIDLPPIAAAFTFFLLRLAVGQIFMVHGWKKIRRQEGDGRFSISLGIVEVLVGALFFLGLWSQYVATVLGLIVFGAIFFKLFVWRGHRYVSNIEYDILILFAVATIFVNGPGLITLSLIT